MGGVQDRGQSELTTGAAINRVLEAEQEAIEAVNASRHDSEAILLEARRQASEISARADKRISRIRKKGHKLNKKYLKKSQKNLGFDTPISSTDPQAADLVAQVARQLAARMTRPRPDQDEAA